MKNGVPFTLYKRKDEEIIPLEGELVFNLNVLEECVEKYSKMDDILNAFSNIKAAKKSARSCGMKRLKSGMRNTKIKEKS